MDLTVRIWRQKDAETKGSMQSYRVTGVSDHQSFLEMLDTMNEQLIAKGEDPVAFDHDCREGICGMCSLVINGKPHGPWKGTTICQLHMREYEHGDTITIEPWRAGPFPVLKDLIVDRSAMDRVIEAGGFISARTGGAPDANAIPIPKAEADISMDGAACIGCGACVAACPNASVMLFVAAKIAHLGHLPQGQPERKIRALKMVGQMDAEGFGNCTNHYECEVSCPKEIPVLFIAEMNRDFIRASFSG